MSHFVYISLSFISEQTDNRVRNDLAQYAWLNNGANASLYSQTSVRVFKGRVIFYMNEKREEFRPFDSLLDDRNNISMPGHSVQCF